MHNAEFRNFLFSQKSSIWRTHLMPSSPIRSAQGGATSPMSGGNCASSPRLAAPRRHRESPAHHRACEPLFPSSAHRAASLPQTCS